MKPTGIRVVRMLAVVSATWAAACGSSSTSAPPPQPSAAPTASGATGCEVRPGGQAGPVTDPSGPYYHQAAVAPTDDGVRIGVPRQVLDHASVPDGVRTVGGDILIYYVNGLDGGVWVARLDGGSATPLGPISLDGVSAPAGIVDPDGTRMPDGRIRLAYLSGFGAPGTAGARAMCLADSEDGIRFTVVGPAIRLPEGDTTTDPSLLRLPDGSWLMAMSRGQQTVLARSADGLSFTTYNTVSFGGVPELAAAPGGRVRLYVCARGIESHVSADGGRTWTREGTVVPPGTLGRSLVCDPSLVEGASLFVFKTAN
jgi:hypothetical protein